MDQIRLAEIRETPLSVEECIGAVAHPCAGGVALFVGVVRDHDNGHAVLSLEYQAHPLAGSTMVEVAERVAAALPVTGLAVLHRIGQLEVGDLAVVVAASCPHRAEAFEAARMLIDEVKAKVPIWKRQVFSDGSVSWVGCEDLAHSETSPLADGQSGRDLEKEW